VQEIDSRKCCPVSIVSLLKKTASALGHGEYLGQCADGGWGYNMSKTAESPGDILWRIFGVWLMFDSIIVPKCGRINIMM